LRFLLRSGHSYRLLPIDQPDGTVVSFKYDPFGRRIEKSVDGFRTRYFYDSEDILFEYDESGHIGNKYIHGPGIDEPLALINNKGVYYYHADGLGSIVALTDSSAKVVQEYEYDSFGNLHDQQNRIKQPYAFTGREWDRETGLYYYRARYYDAEAGRFISFDPILHLVNDPTKKACGGSNIPSGVIVPLELNPYLYVKNRPLNETDPMGTGNQYRCETLKIVCMGECQQKCYETSGTYIKCLVYCLINSWW